MDFKIGLSVKPKEIDSLNRVIFVNASDVITTATEDECSAYGFIYNKAQCYYLYDDTKMIPDTQVANIGSRNHIEENVLDTAVIGIDNILYRESNNSLIVGDSNALSSASNTLIIGTKSEATYNNTQVLGGNKNDDLLGERQNTLVLAGADTTTAAWAVSKLNDDGTTLFNIKDNTIVSFTAFVTGVRVGGTGAGNNGDFKSWIERGTAVTRGSTPTIKRIRQSIGTDGTTTGWNATADVNIDNNLRVRVKGANNNTIKWIIRLEITELRTGVDLS